MASAEEIDSWHRERGFECIGYHYVVQPSGLIEDGRDLDYIGAHCRGKNFDSIGVALVGDFRATEPTYEQINSIGGLYHTLCTKYDKTLLVEFHRVSPNPCPGPMFDREDFIEQMSKFDPWHGSWSALVN
jgi:N-acetylmuramoyl-L-alanine amidase